MQRCIFSIITFYITRNNVKYHNIIVSMCFYRLNFFIDSSDEYFTMIYPPWPSTKAYFLLNWSHFLISVMQLFSRAADDIPIPKNFPHSRVGQIQIQEGSEALLIHTRTHAHARTHARTHAHTHARTHAHTHTQRHTHTHTHTERDTHTHTHVGFYGLRGLSIGVMVFILYKLYVLLPYTYPTPKLSPHRRRCIYIFPQNTHSVWFISI